jgi:hypothetical protein
MQVIQKIIRITDNYTFNREILSEFTNDGWIVKMINTVASSSNNSTYFHTIIVLEKNE